MFNYSSSHDIDVLFGLPSIQTRKRKQNTKEIVGILIQQIVSRRLDI